MEDGHDGVGLREVGALVVAPVGELREAPTAVGWVLVDGRGEEVVAVSDFFASLLAGGARAGSVRSYGLAILRWWRFLAAVGVDWRRASRVETRDFVLWMRCPSKRSPGGTSAAAAY